MIEKGVAIWQDPKEAVALAAQGTAFAGDIATLALMTRDSPTRFKGKPGVAKRAAWARPISLAAVKAAGKARHASVNDVLLSCAAGALRSYLVDKGDPVRGVMIRALVPVNLRPLEKAHELGNQFGLVYLDLPIGIEDPLRRLHAVRANMNALKTSTQPVLSLGLLAAMGAGPRILQDQLLLALSRNATAVMTNVPGPQQPLYLAGAEVGEPAGLGAAVGRHRHGRVDPVLQRKGPVRPGDRPRTVPGPGAHHRTLRRGVRQEAGRRSIRTGAASRNPASGSQR